MTTIIIIIIKKERSLLLLSTPVHSRNPPLCFLCWGKEWWPWWSPLPYRHLERHWTAHPARPPTTKQPLAVRRSSGSSFLLRKDKKGCRCIGQTPKLCRTIQQTEWLPPPCPNVRKVKPKRRKQKEIPAPPTSIPHPVTVKAPNDWINPPAKTV